MSKMNLNYNAFLGLVKYPGFGAVRVDKENDHASALFVDFDRSISLFVSYWGADWKYAPSIEVCVRDMNRHEVDRKIEIRSYDDLKEARKFIETVIA